MIRKRLLLTGICTIVALLTWNLAGAAAPLVGHPAQQQIKLLLQSLADSEAEHATGAYIPGMGAVITMDLLRGPNVTKDTSAASGTLNWMVYLMQTFGPQLNAVPSNETIAMSVDYYDYTDNAFHQLVVTSAAAGVADPNTYRIWLDGQFYSGNTDAPQQPQAPPQPTQPIPVARATPAPTSAIPVITPTPVLAPATSIQPSPGVATSANGTVLITSDVVNVPTDVHQWTPVNGVWAFTDQGYAQTELGKYDLVSLYNQPVGGNFAFQADVKFIEGQMGAGLVFAAPSGDSKNGASMISYTGEGRYFQWGYFDNAGVYQFQGGSNVANGGDTNWHTLAVTVTGTTYSISLDGKQLAQTIPLNNKAGGHIGLLASTTHVVFTNVKLLHVAQ